MVAKHGLVECEFNDIDLNEDYFRRSFVVDWASLDYDLTDRSAQQVLGVPISSYKMPQEFYVTTQFDLEEDYHVARGTSKVVDDEEKVVVTFPDNVLVSWKDANKERRRDVALLFVGTFLGLLASVALELTRKYA